MMTNVDWWLRVGSATAWLICIACLAPAVLRLFRGRGRYLDPIWSLVFLLAINRLTFLAAVSREASHATAICMALAMAMMTLSYQRHDRELGQ